MNKFIFVSVLATLGVSAHAGNLLVNSGFETGALAPWTQDVDYSFGTGVNWHVTDTEAYTGTYSATNEGNMRLTQYFSGISGADVTDISFAVKQPIATVNAYDLIYSDSSIEEFFIFPSDSNWHVYDATSNVNIGKTLVGFGLYGLTTNGDQRTYLDDVKVCGAVPEPATMAALGLGLVGIVRRRRK